MAVELLESMRKALERIEIALKVPGLRWVKLELCHLTLKFLREVPEEKVQGTKETLKGGSRSAFSTSRWKEP